MIGIDCYVVTRKDDPFVDGGVPFAVFEMGDELSPQMDAWDLVARCVAEEASEIWSRWKAPSRILGTRNDVMAGVAQHYEVWRLPDHD